MTAVSFSMSRGVDGFKMSDVTVGTSAPGSGDVELRFNVLDTNSHNMNDLDLVRILDAFKRWVLTGGTTAIAITQQPSGPPN
ncbi:MAG TPA: hypothetical protein VL048_03700 [Xanthobacteraceae bacterium]|nr:hypothetical protein [Xanthobacteraceae bacterium]